jgi:8-oxo-dGTP pyrophosphatase MutT (NUDIX family)
VLKKQEVIYKGKIITLSLDTVVMPEGKSADLEIVRHPGGAGVVAIDDQERVCLVRQHRHAIGEALWELPAGKLDPGEDPLAAAKRELVEETGVQASEWLPLGRMISSPGVFSEIVYLYLARGLTLTETSRDEHEFIEVQWMPVREALVRAAAGDIDDAKTITGLFRAIPRVAKA